VLNAEIAPKTVWEGPGGTQAETKLSKINKKASQESPGGCPGTPWGPQGAAMRKRRQKESYSPPPADPKLRHFQKNKDNI
jgi:hypothetical protein